MNEKQLIVYKALEEVGYLGKRSNKDLDDKTANAGGKYTKYARDLDNLKDFYRQSKLASPSYLEYDAQFSADTETLISKILSEQSIDVNVDNENLNTNYQSLVVEMNKIIK